MFCLASTVSSVFFFFVFCGGGSFLWCNGALLCLQRACIFAAHLCIGFYVCLQVLNFVVVFAWFLKLLYSFLGHCKLTSKASTVFPIFLCYTKVVPLILCLLLPVFSPHTKEY